MPKVDIVIKAMDTAARDRGTAKEKNHVQKYDIVAVFPEGKSKGKETCLPMFMVLQMEGDYEKLKYLQGKYISIDEKTGTSTIIAERLYQFNYDEKMTSEDLNEIKESDKMVFKTVSTADVYTKLII